MRSCGFMPPGRFCVLMGLLLSLINISMQMARSTYYFELSKADQVAVRNHCLAIRLIQHNIINQSVLYHGGVIWTFVRRIGVV